uniref:Uncharacterized protein n=1 Tax=Phakopsora pachyrhizi TaxID=170000 RepID=A0A0S1MIF1_PHAPC
MLWMVALLLYALMVAVMAVAVTGTAAFDQGNFLTQN